MNLKYRIVTVASLIFIISYMIISYNLPISKKIYQSKIINIVVFTPEQFIINLNPDNNLLIKEINNQQKVSRSIIDTTSEILKQLGGETVQNDDIIYIKTTKEEFKQLIENLENWQEKPLKLFRLFQIFFNFETNILIPDKFTLLGYLLKSKNILYIKMAISDKNYKLGETKTILPSASILFYNSKSGLIKKISKKLKESEIDVLEEKKITKKSIQTYVAIKSEEELDLAKKIVFILNQKNEVPIKINPEIIYDAEICVGDDFKEERWK